MVVEADEGSTEENFQIRAALESLGASLAADKIDEAGSSGWRNSTRRCRPPASRRTHATPNSTGNSI
jgi:DNA-binding GntR family transcriptional regulator